MLEHVWVYQYTEHGEIGHCSRCGISDESPSQVCISDAEAKLRRLPADWEKDSSLETWFPLTAEYVKKIEAENVELRKRIESVGVWADCAALEKENDALSKGVHQLQDRIAQLEADNLNLRRKIHNLERHNQHFERCESSWCNPSSDPTELSKIPQGDLAKLETIRQLEVEIERLRAVVIECTCEEKEQTNALLLAENANLKERCAILDGAIASYASGDRYRALSIQFRGKYEQSEAENAELRQEIKDLKLPLHSDRICPKCREQFRVPVGTVDVKAREDIKGDDQ